MLVTTHKELKLMWNQEFLLKIQCLFGPIDGTCFLLENAPFARRRVGWITCRSATMHGLQQIASVNSPSLLYKWQPLFFWWVLQSWLYNIQQPAHEVCHHHRLSNSLTYKRTEGNVTVHVKQLQTKLPVRTSGRAHEHCMPWTHFTEAHSSFVDYNAFFSFPLAGD